jgi:hypothetical protein
MTDAGKVEGGSKEDMEVYDLNKDGKLDEEEKKAMKEGKGKDEPKTGEEDPPKGDNGECEPPKG